MENDLLDDGILALKNKFDYPFFLVVIALLNVVFTIITYMAIKPKIGNVVEEPLILLVNSEACVALSQASNWVLLTLLYDILQSFWKAIKEGSFWTWGLNVFLWLATSTVVVFFVTILIFIPRIIFLSLMFVIDSLLQTNFELEGIASSPLYLLTTIVFTTGILCYYNSNQQTES